MRAGAGCACESPSPKCPWYRSANGGKSAERRPQVPSERAPSAQLPPEAEAPDFRLAARPTGAGMASSWCPQEVHGESAPAEGEGLRRGSRSPTALGAAWVGTCMRPLTLAGLQQQTFGAEGKQAFLSRGPDFGRRASRFSPGDSKARARHFYLLSPKVSRPQRHRDLPENLKKCHPFNL